MVSNYSTKIVKVFIPKIYVSTTEKTDQLIKPELAEKFSEKVVLLSAQVKLF